MVAIPSFKSLKGLSKSENFKLLNITSQYAHTEVSLKASYQGLRDLFSQHAGSLFKFHLAAPFWLQPPNLQSVYQKGFIETPAFIRITIHNLPPPFPSPHFSTLPSLEKQKNLLSPLPFCSSPVTRPSPGGLPSWSFHFQSTPRTTLLPTFKCFSIWERMRRRWRRKAASTSLAALPGLRDQLGFSDLASFSPAVPLLEEDNSGAAKGSTLYLEKQYI